MKLGTAVAGTLLVALTLCYAKPLPAAPLGATGQNSQAQSATPASAAGTAKPASADALKPASYVGSTVCKTCHSAQVKEFSDTMMGKLFVVHPRDEAEKQGCETCHGPGSLYIKDMTAAKGKGRTPGAGTGPAGGGLITFRKDSGESVSAQNEVCLQCHEKGARDSWRASTHAFRGVGCVDCHTVMRKVSPRSQLAKAQDVSPIAVTRPETQVCLRCHLKKKAQMNLPSHMPVREGRMTCVDCHNPHGGPYANQLKRATVNEVCYTCHAEKRGPVLWPHPPVLMNCSNCHEPHGTVNDRLLKIRVPRLCQQCHMGTGHPVTPRPTNTVFVFNRACTNCHSQIHGSNFPNGRFFTR